MVDQQRLHSVYPLIFRSSTDHGGFPGYLVQVVPLS